jgi:hypothetical protein
MSKSVADVSERYTVDLTVFVVPVDPIDVPNVWNWNRYLRQPEAKIHGREVMGISTSPSHGTPPTDCSLRKGTLKRKKRS